MLLDNILRVLEKWGLSFFRISPQTSSASKEIKFQPGKPGGRIDFIDFLRASAVILMIFAHVLDAVLAVEYKHNQLYNFFNFMNGFVAPAFLFTAGASFTIIITKRKNDILNFRWPAFKQLWKVFQLFALGYLLHLPYKTLHQMQTIMTIEQYRSFLRIDVLHIIAVGLLISQVVFVIVRNEKKLFIVTMILALISIAVTPFARSFDFANIFPVGIATYFNKNFNSIFPLFPWISYIFFGSMIMFVVMKYSAEGKLEDIFKKLFFGCSILILLAAIPEFMGLKPNDKYNFWHTSPNIVCIKLGFVLIYMIGMWFFQKRFNYRMKILKIFGQESLFVYVFHLIIVYGSVLSTGLAQSIGRSKNVWEMFAVYFSVVLISLLFTMLWHRIKKFSLLFSRIIIFSTFIYFFYYFMTKLY
jgi:uncharacterized membrane protein